jgi:hypothetical protein
MKTFAKKTKKRKVKSVGRLEEVAEAVINNPPQEIDLVAETLDNK